MNRGTCMHLLIETGSRNRCRGLRALLQAGVLVVTAGCAAMHESPDFERHRLSQLVEPYDRTDVYYFDATFTPAYPDGDPDAEAVRM